MRRWLAIGAVALAALVPLESTWAGWYNASWGYRVEVEVPAANVDEALPWFSFPMSGLGTTFWSNVKAAGADVRVTEGDGTTELPYFILGFSDAGTSGTGRLVVQSSSWMSASTNERCYVYFGNAAASAYAVGDTYGQYNVFDANTVAVYFPGMSTNNYVSASYGLTAVNSPGTASSDYEGITAARYNGTNQYHWASSSPVSDWPVTLESLFAADSDAKDGYMLALRDTASSTSLVILDTSGISGGDPVRGQARGTAGGISTVSTSTGFTATTWHHGATTAVDGSQNVYIDGGSNGSATPTLFSPNWSSVAIGAGVSTTVSGYFDGDIAMDIVHDVERSANYLATSAAAWGDDFVVYGVSEDYVADNTGWFEFTAAVTTTPGTDAWVNPTRALSSLALGATVAVEEGDSSQTLQVTNASAALASFDDALEIVGVEVEIAYYGDNGGTEEMEDNLIQLILSGSQTGNNKATTTLWETTATPSYINVGGTSDTWGLGGLTMADFKAPTSGVALQVESVGGVSSEPEVECLRIRMRLTYTVASSAATGGFFPFFN